MMLSRVAGGRNSEEADSQNSHRVFNASTWRTGTHNLLTQCRQDKETEERQGYKY